jgi:hypothetical protein
MLELRLSLSLVTDFVRQVVELLKCLGEVVSLGRYPFRQGSDGHRELRWKLLMIDCPSNCLPQVLRKSWII